MPVRTLSSVAFTPTKPTLSLHFRTNARLARGKGIVRADDSAKQVLKNRKNLKRVRFTTAQTEVLLTTFPSTADLVKQSDFKLGMTEVNSKLDLLSAKVEKWLLATMMFVLLLANPECLSSSFAAKLLSPLLSIFVK